MFVSGYGHYLRTAASLQWDEAAVDLSADAAAWPSVPAAARERLQRLIAGFCFGEAQVAEELAPFAAASSGDVAACFAAQAIDEARHARFFARVALELLGTGAPALREHVEPAFAELFEQRLPAAARRLASGAGLRGAVALYHLVLEGIVFTAGQLAALELLDAHPELPGLRRGMELVLLDERWHIGFGTRLLTALDGDSAEIALAEAARAVEAWGAAVPAGVRERVLKLHGRRLAVAKLTISEVTA